MAACKNPIFRWETAEKRTNHMAGEHTLKFDNDNFEAEVLQSEIPVLVDFWAEWCGPCLMLGPVIDDLAEIYNGKIKVGKLDIDKSPEIAARFGVQNIPTVLLFEQGEASERIVGAKPKREFETILNAKIGPDGL